MEILTAIRFTSTWTLTVLRLPIIKQRRVSGSGVAGNLERVAKKPGSLRANNFATVQVSLLRAQISSSGQPRDSLPARQPLAVRHINKCS
mmetsp:Transcript_40327/g.93493  ORF Transcript_40327/g.93493 Transcript_40327/m.93493 type:complete len:90 (+) Transcript_40327:228-497(+)